MLANDTSAVETTVDNTWLALTISVRGQFPQFIIEDITFQGSRGTGLSIWTTTAPNSCLIRRCDFRSNNIGLEVQPRSSSWYPIKVIDSGFVENRTGFILQASARLDGCTIARNRAAGGQLASGLSSLHNCTIVENGSMNFDTVGLGGGISLTDGPGCGVYNCLIAGNISGTNGGGILAAGSHYVEVSDCLIANNQARLYGGGACGPVIVSRSTIVGNTAWMGGGVHAMPSWASPTMVGWSIFAGNSAAYGPNISSLESPIRIDSVLGPSIQQGLYLSQLPPSFAETGSLFDADPAFVDPAGPDADPSTWWDNDHRLSPRSPAMDLAGTWSWSQTDTDLEGSSRRVPSVVGAPAVADLGCYEFQRTLCPADMDGDGGVTVDDLLLYLRLFAEGDIRASTPATQTSSRDFSVTIDDLVAYIAAFSAGC